ncbi:hypothetical protein VP395_04740 [Mariniflexile soesokkakense]|uniref:Uncharacterized protein n=1 Tax=Mariniflexile soesokkakense TaxID=1343160 RepID=A0ABV0A886_9FLAO
MKVFVLTLLFCIGIYILTKATLTPSFGEVSNTMNKLNCTPPYAVKTNSSHQESCCIILDRTSIILKQNARQEAQN